MLGRVEALFGDARNGGDGSDSSFSGVRLGSSFCEELLPDSEEVNRAVEACAVRNVPLAIVTPFVTDRGLEQVLRIAEIVKGAGLELVVNDWGVLFYLSKSCGRLTAGRLLTATKGDPRIAQVWGKIGPQGKEVYRRKPVIEEYQAGRLSGLGVKAFELDIPPWGIEMPGESPGELFYHQPLCYVTVSRWCPTRVAVEGRNVFSGPCPRPCLDMAMTLRNKATGQLILRGNAYFTSSGPIVEVAEQSGASQTGGIIIPYWFHRGAKTLETVSC